MSAPTCVSCNKAFGANGELASLPEGRRIAFDPGQRRVWRICTKCGEWNLLGAEAARAALGELEARQPATAAGVQTAHLSGRLELLRVNSLEAAELAQFARAERHRALAKTAAARPKLVVLLVVSLVGMMAAGSWLTGGGVAETVEDSLRLAATMGYAAFWRSLDRLWQRVPAKLWLWASGVAGPALQVALDWSRPGVSLGDQIGTNAMVTLLFYLLLRNERWTGDQATQGPKEWDQVKLRWRAHPPQIQLRPLREEWLGAEASEAMLRTILTVTIAMRITPMMVEDAVAFTRQSGLLGLLGVLEQVRERGGGEVTLGAIPLTYLIALDLVLAGAAPPSAAANVERANALEAGAVAEIAESLDRGDG